MINAASIEAVDGARLNAQFVRPLYDGYGFAQIPQTIRHLLTEDAHPGVPFGPRSEIDESYDTVILFFVDAFGWRFFQEFADQHPFLRRFQDQGVISKLTSQFPSTTAAHVTAMHTGLPVGQSGVYEWFYYEPLIDEVIAPLLFSFAGEHERDTLARTGLTAGKLFPNQTLYGELSPHGIHSTVFQNHAYAFSPYTKIVTSGATIMPYRTLPEAIVNLHQLMDQQRGKAYYFLYFDNIDAICHLYGPESRQTHAEIATFLDIMERVLQPGLSKRPRTLFLLTADHGQTAIDPATTVYLNLTLPELLPLLKQTRTGRPVVPVGSSRDLFLHINEGLLDEAEAMLRNHLGARAEIHRVSDLIDRGYFGSLAPAPTFLSRVGDLVILPYRGESVWWYEKGKFEQNFYGAHGGLTIDEMETMLLAQPYG